MTEPSLDVIDHMPARELLQLPLETIDRLLAQAKQETRKAQSREKWLFTIRAKKTGLRDEQSGRDHS